jgi:hypothetical protein
MARGQPRKTEKWFSDARLATILSRYQSFSVTPLSYGTVRDYCDSFDNANELAVANGDLKDCQRPWTLKAILSQVRRGGRILEIGAGEPFVGDILDRLGYEVWVVDPYDGSGNGPVEFERYQSECPGIRFIRSHFSRNLLAAPPKGFDCIYSISVLEHIPKETLPEIFHGMKKFLRPDGWSIHTIDHVHRGNRAAEHLLHLQSLVRFSGHEKDDLGHLFDQMDRDSDVYYLSAESHNRWRGSLPYDEFPMRVCASVQVVSSASRLRIP